MPAAADLELAGLYGVAPAIIEGLRVNRCELGVHWVRADGVRYLAEGLDLITVLLGLEKKEGGRAAPPAPGRVKLLRVVRICPNPTWVLVRGPGNGTEQIRVRNNRGLSCQMQLRCLRIGLVWHCAHEGQIVDAKLLTLHRVTTDPAGTPGT